MLLMLLSGTWGKCLQKHLGWINENDKKIHVTDEKINCGGHDGLRKDPHIFQIAD